MATTPVLSIDATKLDGIDFTTYIADHFAGLGAGANTFWGGTPDAAFGATYYLNGSQILSRYADAGGAGQAPAVALLGGATLAYDFIHYGPAYGHGITGSVDTLTFGDWVAGQTTGTQGIGASGAITGLDAGLGITGWGLSAAPGAGFDPTVNKVYALYHALEIKDAGAIYDLIAKYSLDVTGSAKNDTFAGYANTDTLAGGAGQDRLYGNGKADLLDGGAGHDKLYGGTGDDVLHGMAGNDRLDGGYGKDKLYGGTGVDALSGGFGDDLLEGGTGNDNLFGNAGKDKLHGGTGDDMVRGGAGNDVLSGGAGADSFVFETGAGVDRITDFSLAEDVIDLRDFHLAGLGDIAMLDTGAGARLQVEDVAITMAGIEIADLGAGHFLI